MPLEPRMILTAVHVFGQTPEGTVQGTGFIMAVKSEHEALQDKRWGYVLTAHHVIRRMDPVHVRAANAFGGGEMYPPRKLDGWVQPIPGLDLAVAPFPELLGQKYFAMDWENMLPTEGVKPIGSPLLGSPIYYIGLFAPAQRMMARLGSVGSLDLRGLNHDPTANPPYDYICHLIDCRSYGGFSGSPCFFNLVYAKLEAESLPSPYEEHAPPNLPEMGGMMNLAVPCGMFTEHYDDSGQQSEVPDTNEVAVSRYGVGVMVRGQEIKEALMTEEMKAQRRQWDVEFLDAVAKMPKVGPKNARASGRSASIEATADPLSKLVQIPREEADDVHREHKE